MIHLPLALVQAGDVDPLSVRAQRDVSFALARAVPLAEDRPDHRLAAGRAVGAQAQQMALVAQKVLAGREEGQSAGAVFNRQDWEDSAQSHYNC